MFIAAQVPWLWSLSTDPPSSRTARDLHSKHQCSLVYMLLLGFANQKTVSGDEDLAKDLHVQDQPDTSSLGCQPGQVTYSVESHAKENGGPFRQNAEGKGI